MPSKTKDKAKATPTGKSLLPFHKAPRGKRDPFCGTKSRGDGKAMRFTADWKEVTCTRCIAKNKDGTAPAKAETKAADETGALE